MRTTLPFFRVAGTRCSTNSSRTTQKSTKCCCVIKQVGIFLKTQLTVNPEAKYDVKDVFFVDKAPDPEKHTLEYKIGDKQFWKESGCEWEKQLARYKNTPSKKKREDWEPLMKKRWELDKKEQQEDRTYKNEDGPLKSNNIRFAPKDYRDAQLGIIKKKIGKSHVQQAKERMESLGKFYPGPTYGPTIRKKKHF